MPISPIRQRPLHGALLISLIAVAAAMFDCTPAGANSTGITGFSGKAGANLICNSCHAGGTAPTVEFQGPTQVAPSETATFLFIIHSEAQGQTAAGFNVAGSAGTLAVVDGQGERLLGGELTHQMPKNNVDGVATFEFTWQAPAAPGTYTLFGAGNSVNRNGTQLGDRAAATRIDVNVAQADTPTPTPTPTPSPSPGTPTSTRGPVACVGDCNDDGEVMVNELVRGVNIALETAPVSQCLSFDVNDSGTVTVNELVSGVNALILGCE